MISLKSRGFLILAAVLTASLFLLSCFGLVDGGDMERDTVNDTKENTGEGNYVENPENTYAGTLKYETSADYKTVKISYELNGETVSYTVPNNANYLSGGFAATDDLSRSLPTSLTTGIYGENGEHYVGLFYFLWHGEHGDAGVYDLEKIKN